MKLLYESKTTTYFSEKKLFVFFFSKNILQKWVAFTNNPNIFNIKRR